MWIPGITNFISYYGSGSPRPWLVCQKIASCMIIMYSFNIVLNLNFDYILTQVSQLIVLNEAYDAGQEEKFPNRLLDNVAAVQRSIEHLVSVSNRINEDIKDNVSTRLIQFSFNSYFCNGSIYYF